MVSDNIIEANIAQEEDETLLDSLELSSEELPPIQASPKVKPTGTLLDDLQVDLPPLDPVEQNRTAAQGITVDSMEPEAAAEFEFEGEQLEILAKSMYDDAQIQAIKDKGPIGFWEAKDFLDYEDVAPGGGVFQAIDSIALLKAADNIKNGKELSIGQQELMHQFIKERVEIGLRTKTTGGSIATGLMQMPAFMVEFVASGGIGKLGQVAAQKTATKKIGAAALATVSTSLAPSLLPRYAAGVGERRVNQSMAITEKGDLIAKENVESPAKTALMAFGHHTIEVGSELSGGALAQGAKYVLKPVTKAVSPIVKDTVKPVLKSTVMAGVNKLPASVRVALLDAAKEIKPNATVGKVFSQAGWNGILEEIGEERLAQILGSTLDLAADDNVTFDNYLDTIIPDKDQLLIEAGIISIAGGVKGSSNMAVNLLESKLGSRQAAMDTVNNMTVSEQEAFVAEQTAPRADPDLIKEDGEVQVDYTESSFTDFKNTLKEKSEDVYVALFNDIYHIEKVSAEATAAGNVVNPADNLANTARRLRANSKLMEENLITGTTRTNPETGQVEKTGVGYRQILEGWDAVSHTIEPNVKTRSQDFNDYRAALSTLDDVQLEGVEVSPEAQAKAEGDIARLQEKYGEEAVWLDRMSQESTEYTQRVLVNLVDAGVLSQEFYDQKIAERPNYTVMRRVLEEEVLNSTGLSVDQFSDIKDTGPSLKKRKGSDKEVVDINSSIMQYTADILKLAETAKLGQQMAQISEYLPERVQKVAGTPGPFESKDQIPYWENGDLKWLKVDEPLVQAFKHLERTVPKNIVTKFLDAFFRIPSTILRTGATSTPEFAIRNFLRDTHSSFINSGGKLTPINVLDGLATQLFDKETVDQFYRDGAGFNSVRFANNVETEKVYRQMLEKGGHTDQLVKYLNPLFTMNKINELFEGAPRVGLYKKLQKDGMTGIEAALAARDITLDFQRGGSAGRFINRYVPFFNASLQGIDKTARVFRDNPKEAAMWAGLTITMPQMLLTGWYLYGADEETRQRYLELSDYQRDLGWPMGFTDDGSPILYPKPFTVGYLFGSSIERLMIHGATKEGDAEMQKFWQSTFGGTIAATSPIKDPAAAFPVVAKLFTELTSNYSFFYESNIVPPYMEGNSGVQPRDRKNTSTSQTASELGNLFNVSPAKLDYTVGSLTGGAGKDYLIPLSDAFIRRYKALKGEEYNKPIRTLNDIPVIRAFADDPPLGPRSRSVNNFYNNLEKSNQAYNSYNDREGEEADKFYEKNVVDIEARKPMNKAYKKLRKLNKEARAIKEDSSLSNQEKIDGLLEVEGRITEIARDANTKYKELKKDKE